MHQDLLQLQACQDSSDDPKTQVSKIMIFWDHLDWCLGARWPKLPISLKYFWAIILSLDRNDINNFGPKGQSFQNKSSHEKRCFNLEGHLWHTSLPGVDKSWKKKNKKIDCHVMHLKNSIKSKRKSKSQKRDVEKNDEKTT